MIQVEARQVERLGSLCGLLGSEHAGERAAAALAATKQLQGMGLSWRELVQRAFEVPAARPQPQAAKPRKPPGKDPRWVAEVNECTRGWVMLDAFERKFLLSMMTYNCHDDLSDKQRAIFDRILATARRGL